MNTTCLWAAVLVLLSGTTLAQSPQNEPTKSADAEYARIRAERRIADEKYAYQEVLCYQYFAVNDCLGRARVKRREIAADLRRQELSITANEARRRGAEQVSRGEEKTSPKALRELEKRLLDAQERQHERMEALELKAAQRVRTQEESSIRLMDYQARRQAQREADRTRATKQGEAENNRREYELKQKAALERKTAKPSTPTAGSAKPVTSK